MTTPYQLLPPTAERMPKRGVAFWFWVLALVAAGVSLLRPWLRLGQLPSPVELIVDGDFHVWELPFVQGPTFLTMFALMVLAVLRATGRRPLLATGLASVLAALSAAAAVGLFVLLQFGPRLVRPLLPSRVRPLTEDIGPGNGVVLFAVALLLGALGALFDFVAMAQRRRSQRSR